ncbi:MAG: hypothetical protein FJ147_10435 [Deltaproteobacteria bacterium]|nr:hypothetical protein [Deltaproteobacteria bacterium]
MATKKVSRVVDAAGRGLEPRDMWQRYIDPHWCDHALCREYEENGWEVLPFNNNPERGTLRCK